jgi:nucleotide-binding universal stress UspA family protein
MSILCGFDFSDSSRRAAEVAAELSLRLKVPLHLLHVIPPLPGEILPQEEKILVFATERALDGEAAKLRRSGLELKLHVVLSNSIEAVTSSVQRLGATLLVLGATGKGESHDAKLGRAADRLAKESKVPTLVVRDPEPLQAWAKGERPLKVVVGVDGGAASQAAWEWARGLGELGPVELIGAHLYWPPQEFHRLGLSGPRSYLEGDSEVEKALRNELEPLCSAGPNVTCRLALLPNLGRPSDRLAMLGREESADLIVVGSHGKRAITRLWEGSVSRGVLHDAASSVVCVPAVAGRSAKLGSRVKSVLVATDFSPVGDEAIVHAYRVTGAGGKVYLAHVIPPLGTPSAMEARDVLSASPGSEKVRAAAMEKLRALIPPGFKDQPSELVVLESKEPAEAIAQCAERFGVDLVCLGTHGRRGLAHAILGSVAQGVLQLTHRPVLFVREPKA